MTNKNLNIINEISLPDSTLIMGFSGWMDGGNVSTATIHYLIDKLKAEPIAEIHSNCFYLYNFPGSMEVSAILRPPTAILNGKIEQLIMPKNTFYANTSNNLTFFTGNEPNMNWDEYAQCVFDFCHLTGIKTIYFIGSVAGAVPHTRQPRISCVISDESMREQMNKFGLKFTNYQGPSSLVTYMTHIAHQQDILMATLVAEIPAYIQGENPMCIDNVTKRISAMLELNIDHEDLQLLGDDYERKISDVIKNHPELESHISKLEQDYDNEIFDNEMSEMKQWLHDKGIRVD